MPARAWFLLPLLAALLPSPTGAQETKGLKRALAERFAHNVLEAIDVVEEEYVQAVDPGRMVAWAVRELYAHARARIPADVEKRLKIIATLGKEQRRHLLTDARLALGQRDDLKGNKDLTITLERLFRRLDPYTTYTPPERIPLGCQFVAIEGIGAQFARDPRTGELLIVTPIRGGPAHRAGLYAGDVITAVTREDDEVGNSLPRPERTRTRGLPLNQATRLVRGVADSPAILTIRRPGVKTPFDVLVFRAAVQEETVVGVRRKKDDSWDHLIDPDHRIGYIRLVHLDRNTFRDTKVALKELMKGKGFRGLVLDLRFNPGGLLDIAIKLADLFVDEGLILSIQPRGRAATRFDGRRAGSLLGFPLVCLVNGDSVSGSEVVAAALQDHKRAFLIGERSRGKGCVQNIRDFEILDCATGNKLRGEIKLTTAAFLRPAGRKLDRYLSKGRENEWGVVPDRAIALTPAERDDLLAHLRKVERIERPENRGKRTFRDRQLDAALEHLRARLK
jgi:carboxyl-terminal processing protease